MVDDLIAVGKIGAPWGIRGWLRVWSYLDPAEQLLEHEQVTVTNSGKQERLVLEQGQVHGRSLVVLFQGLHDRDAAARWTGLEIGVLRSELPPPEEGEYYWTDLIGLRVVTSDNLDLGLVDSLIETGANDVLVVVGERKRYIPYLVGSVIQQVNLKTGVIRADWDPEF